MAMLKLVNDPEWQQIGGRLIIPVHDELIVEVPYELREKGAEVLARCMCDAGSFMPFKLTCDVETTFRWYGLGVEDILSFDKPSNLDWDNMTPSNISWIQCMLIENEFILPTYPEPDGSKPIGLHAEGVNGILSDEVKQYLSQYMKQYDLSADTVLDHIERKVMYGTT